MKDNLNIGIIGNGKMGADIFNYIDSFNLPIVWVHKNFESAEVFKEKYFNKYLRQLNKGLINQNDYDFKNQHIIITSDLKKAASCNIIIEAISESYDKKIKLFKNLFNLLDDKAIICSNTSSLNINKLTNNKDRLKKIAGLHFFYPVKLKNIAEINTTQITEKKTIIIIKKFLDKIKKKYIVLTEKNNFVLNKIFLDLQAESFRILNDYNATIDEIDHVVKKNIFPIGVFELFDNVGIDVIYNSVINYIEEYDNKNFYMPMLNKLNDMIKKNKLGLKTKEGFYNYNKERENKPVNEKEYFINIYERILTLYINGFYKAIQQSKLTIEEINYAVKEYMLSEKGPIDLLKEININSINKLFKKYNFNKKIINYCKH